MIDPETGQPDRPCRPRPARAVCYADQCLYADDADGRRSTAGRRDLARYLVEGRDAEPREPGHCACEKCCDHGRSPLSPSQVDDVLHHLTDRDAVLFLLGFIDFAGCIDCEYCGGPVAQFVDSVKLPGVRAMAGCPYHPNSDEPVEDAR